MYRVDATRDWTDNQKAADKNPVLPSNAEFTVPGDVDRREREGVAADANQARGAQGFCAISPQLTMVLGSEEVSMCKWEVFFSRSKWRCL